MTIITVEASAHFYSPIAAAKTGEEHAMLFAWKCHRYMRTLPALLLGMMSTATMAVTTYTFTNIADTMEGFSTPRSVGINNSGTVVFLAPGLGIFSGSGSKVSSVATAAGDTFRAHEFGTPAINNEGVIAFKAAAFISGERGLYIASDGALRKVHDNPFLNDLVFINDSQQVVYREGFGGVSVSNPNGPPTPVAGVAAISGGEHGTINSAGAVAFRSSALPGFGNGIFVGNGEEFRRIATTGGSFVQFNGSPAINDAGSVVFHGSVSTTQPGIFVGNGERLRPSIADSSGDFDAFGIRPSINNLGVVAYTAAGAGIASGIFTGGTHISKVLRSGDSLFGSTVVTFDIDSDSINDVGQVAFRYRLSNGVEGIGRADPNTMPGDAPWDPLLPTLTDGSTFRFFPETARPLLPRGWYDPPSAHGFEYEILGGEFLEVMGPPGFFNLSVLVAGVVMDSDLDPGESFFFAAGVTKFTIIGITPPVDGNDPVAFPTFLDFSGTPSEIRMMAIPVPEPSIYVSMLVGLVLLGFLARFRPMLATAS